MRPVQWAIMPFYIFLLLNCTKAEDTEPDKIGEEQPEPEPAPEVKVYFTYKNNHKQSSEIWVVIHDENGKLLDYQLMDREPTTHEFSLDEQDIPEKYTVTTLITNQFGNQFMHHMKTYTAVEKGAVWERSPPSPTDLKPEKVGSFQIEITDSPIGSSDEIQTTANRVFELDRESTFDGNTTTVSYSNVALYEGEPYFIMHLDPDYNYRYFSLGFPTEGDSIQVSYNQFVPYDLYPDIALPSYEFLDFISVGYNQKALGNYHSARGTVFTNAWNVKNASSITIGYLEGYEKYFTSLSIYLGEYGYNVHAFGEMIDSIDILPKPTFSVVNNSIYEFKISTDLEFIRKSATWTVGDPGNHTSSTEWEVNSPGGNTHVIGRLPEEIIAANPNLNLENIQFSSINLFTRSIQYSKLSGSGKEYHEFQEDYLLESIFFKEF